MGYRKEEEKNFAINLTMRTCIYILWQKSISSKKEAKAISGRLWDWCKGLCNYEVNVDLTSIAIEQDSEMICSSLNLSNEDQEITALEDPRQKNHTFTKKQGRYCHYCNLQASHVIMLSGVSCRKETLTICPVSTWSAGDITWGERRRF